MIYAIQNDRIKAAVSSRGAELYSAYCNGCEYIWQADPEYWASHAPILFPICSRLFEGKYTYEGKTYEMILHGFARQTEFELVEHTDSKITLKLASSEETKKIYPFDFEFYVTYTLEENMLRTSARIVNTGKDILPATFGGHPGFRAPMSAGSFEDCYLEFGEVCSPDQLIFSDSCLNTGKKKALALEDGKILRLSHSLFDNDAVFMSGQADSVTLRSTADERSLTLRYTGIPYLGIWQKVKSDAPYVCIEPFCGLPAFEGETDDFATKNDMFRLPAGAEKTIGYDMIFN